MRRGVLVGVLVLVLLAVWGLSLLSPAGHAPHQPVPLSTPDVAEPAPSADPPREVPTAVPVAPAAAPPARPPPAAEPRPTLAAPPLPPAEPAAPLALAPTQAKLPSEPARIFSAAFDKESRDPAWANDAEVKVRSAFERAHVPAASVLGVECRAALCKIDMLFELDKKMEFAIAYHSLRQDFAADVALDHLSNPSAVNPERITAYVPRKGYELSDFVR